MGADAVVHVGHDALAFFGHGRVARQRFQLLEVALELALLLAHTLLELGIHALGFRQRTGDASILFEVHAVSCWVVMPRAQGYLSNPILPASYTASPRECTASF